MKKEITDPQVPFSDKKLFLQPLALALACAILIILLFTIRWIDLKALETTLNSYMEDRARELIETVHTETEFYFSRLIPPVNDESNTEQTSPLADEAMNLKERVIIDLLETAQEIEYQFNEKFLNNSEQMAAAADAERLRLISFLDDKGIPSIQNRPIPDNILNLAAPVAQGVEEIKVNLFDSSLDPDGLGYLIVRQKSGQGAILLTYNEKGLRHRNLKLSVQRTLENLGQIQDFEYIQLADQNLMVFGNIGDVPDLQIKDLDVDDFFKNGTEPLSHYISARDIKLLEIVSPIHIAGGEKILVRLGLNREDEEQIIRESRNSLFISMGFMAIISMLAMTLLYINQNRHLARIQEMQRRMLQAERLSALGRLAAGVAHEIRNPLNAISMATQRLQKENLPDLTGVILDEIRRLNQIIQEFLTFSRTGKLKLQSRDLLPFLQQIVLLIDEEAKSKNIIIETQWEKGLVKINMDQDKLKQAILNIFKNAMEAISGKGKITITVKSKDKKWISLKIADTGTGLSREEIENIFDPDYTTKEKGLGLGLPLAHEIIKGHSGTIEVTSQPSKGTTFEIVLPIA